MVQGVNGKRGRGETKMASALMSDAFWSALEQSNLLSAQQLATAKQGRLADESASAEDVSRRLVQAGWLTPFQAERLLEGRSRGFFYDRYKIVDLLGLGGMGWVYQAIDTTSGEAVALKVLRDEFRNDQGMLARFHQEGRVGLTLVHPHIIRTMTLGSAGGLPYMIMELVAGPNLLELLVERRRIPWELACDLARQAALGLEYAHERGVIHRDVKPQNLLIDPSGQVRLLDFGLSMKREGETGEEFSFAMIFGHESVGTLDYAAPEQLADSLAADPRSDIYSLGATLFAALTGVSPGRMDDPEGRRPRRTVRDFVPSIPAGVADVVAKMVDLEPKRRFATARDAAEALAAWSKPIPIAIDFAAILRERKKFAQERMANLSSSRTSGPNMARSTARPASASSFVESVDEERAGRRPAGSIGAPSAPLKTGAATGVLRGPALDWGQDFRGKAKASSFLVCVNNDVRIPLVRDRLVMGRGADCDLQLADNAVSTRHCEIVFDGRRWRVRDLESRNGTQVNGKLVRQQALEHGDEIVIGNQQTFRFDHRPVDGRPGPRGSRRWILWLVVAVIVILAVAGLIASVALGM
jgi:serine/threonine protein kinase